MILLIDGDILVYRVGFASDTVKERYAIARLKSTIERLVSECKAEDYEIFLSDSTENNFRYKIFPLYKQNRTDRKPKHYNELSNTIMETFGGTVWPNIEADDAIGIQSNRLGDDCTIASIDKDLLQLPGQHYNWVNGVFRRISRSQGLYNFYKQILSGDAVDNIVPKVGLSCPGVGSKKAQVLLEGCSTVEEYNSRIWEIYKEHCKDHDEVELHTRIQTTGQLVKIQTEENELWQFERK